MEPADSSSIRLPGRVESTRILRSREDRLFDMGRGGLADPGARDRSKETAKQAEWLEECIPEPVTARRGQGVKDFLMLGQIAGECITLRLGPPLPPPVQRSPPGRYCACGCTWATEKWCGPAEGPEGRRAC